MSTRKRFFSNFYFQKQADTKTLYAKEFDSYFIDIGIPTEFDRANEEFVDFKY